MGWDVRAPVPLGRYAFACGDVMVDRKLVLVGGVNPALAYVPTVDVYDVDTDTWAAGAIYPNGTGIVGAVAGSIGGKLYVALGNDASNDKATGWYYDPVANTWTAIANAPTTRSGGPAAAVHGGKLYTFGGFPPGGGASNTVDAVTWCYDPSSNSWSVKAPMPAERGDARAATIGDFIYVVGGSYRHVLTNTLEDTLFRYDVLANSWSTLSPMPTAREAPFVGVVNGKLHVIAGLGHDPGFPTAAITLDVHERYNPNTDSWDTLDPLPREPRTKGAVGVVDLGIYCAGGWHAGSDFRVEHDRYIGAGGGWSIGRASQGR